MLIINYIFYSFYCLRTWQGINPDDYSRARGIFAFSLTFYTFIITYLVGLRPTLMNWSTYYPVFMLVTSFLFSRLYFTKDRCDYIVSNFNYKMGKWNKFHAVFAALYFLLSGALLIYFSGKPGR